MKMKMSNLRWWMVTALVVITQCVTGFVVIVNSKSSKLSPSSSSSLLSTFASQELSTKKNYNDSYARRRQNAQNHRRRRQPNQQFEFVGGSSSTTTRLYSDKFNRDLEERSYRRAQGEGAGEMAAGAILGGLVLGPFGALFGAQIGANMGAKNAIQRARKEELERLGITQEMLDTARDVGVALQQSMDGLKATKASLETQQSLARRLDRDATEMYDKAKDAMSSNDEDKAREFLFKRTQIQDKLKSVLVQCAQEKKRLETMEENVRVIESRALEVEALLQRTVGAKARLDSSNKAMDDAILSDLSLSKEDPLLQKFRDIGID